jgi:hypothetical protein
MGEMPLDRLDLHNHEILDQQVKAISGIDSYHSVGDRERHLRLNIQTATGQLVRKASLVRAFQQTGSNSCMHGNRSVEDYVTDPVLFFLCELRALCG